MTKANNKTNGRSWGDVLLKYLDVFTLLVMVNLLWVIGSLPLVTLPAATAGLFAVLIPWVRGGSVEPLAQFFGGMRRYGLKSTSLAVMNLVVAGLVILNLLILRWMNIGQILSVLSLSLTMVVAVLAVMTNVYAWPLLVILDLPLPDLLKKSLALVAAYPGWTFLVMGTAVLPLLLSLFLPQAFFLLITFTASGLIISWGAWQVIGRYLNENKINDSDGK